MNYYLGLDVGGTKTHALIADENGRACGFGEAGPGNHETVGYPGLAAALQRATLQALAQARLNSTQVYGAGFGIGGFDWPCERESTLEAFRPLGLNAPLEVVNDAMIGLIAGASQGWGVAVVAGTGCNCWGRDPQNHIGRMTGAGWGMGEAAGAGEIVEEAVRSISRYWSRRGPATTLAQALIQYAGAKDLEDLLEGLVLGRYRIQADAAPLVFQVAAQGDAVAGKIIEWAGRELGGLAAGVIRQLHFEDRSFEVVMVGSLFNGGPMLVEPMRQEILAAASGAQLVRLAAPPVIGAVLLGMEAAGVMPAPKVRENLVKTATEPIASDALPFREMGS